MDWTFVFVALAGTIGGSLLGWRFGASLPQLHRGEESRFVVKMTTGMIATLAALVLGLVTAAAQRDFNEAQGAMEHIAADVITLDRLLDRMGPETDPVRKQLREAVELRLAMGWPTGGQASQLDTPQTTAKAEAIEDQIRDLKPESDTERWFQSRALDISRDLLQSRWTLMGTSAPSIPTAFLAVLLLWLVILFASFGVFAPRNVLALLAILTCAISVSSAIFLILDLDSPFHGVIRLSDGPLRFALSRMGQ